MLNFARKFCSALSAELEKSVFVHKPVLLNEVLNAFNSSSNKIAIDLTFGYGGHSKAILANNEFVKLIGIDRDLVAYKNALEISKSNTHFTAAQAKFSELDKICKENNIQENTVDFILMDLGFSSCQMDDSERGFSLSKNGKLDMRMNQNSNDISAYDVINRLDALELANIFKKYGEERLSRKIANIILEYRTSVGPISTTFELAELVAKCVGWGHKYDALKRKSHPATQVFQAIRIFVNDELNELCSALTIAKRYLTPVSGRCAVISFHSLEDRLVRWAFNGRDFNGVDIALTNIISDKTYEDIYLWSQVGDIILPSSKEIQSNPRCRSAKMRIGKIENVACKYNIS